jgi:20S proteasome alpha/beta subunit
MTLHCVVVVVDAAQNSRRNSRYASSSSSSSSSAYDRLISTFSPDGRLEQVEYSAQAATRTILASIDRERNQIIVVAPTGSLLQLIYCGDDDDDDDDQLLMDDHPTEVEDPSSSTSSSSSSAGHHHSENNKKKPAVLLWMIGTGIAGDVLWLRDFLREQALEHAIVWEDDDNTRGGGTVRQIELLARDAEIICHRRTFVAGARPLGALLFLLGFLANDDDDHASSTTPQLAEVSGWNGAATGLDFACSGPHRETIQAFVQQRRRSTSSTVGTAAQSSSDVVLLETLLDAAQQVLGTKTNLDVWILSADGTTRQYTNVRDRASRRRLVEACNTNCASSGRQ